MIAFSQNRITAADRTIFEALVKMLPFLPDPPPRKVKIVKRTKTTCVSRLEGPIITCHNLCDAIAKVFPTLKVERGWFNPNFEHSWLRTPDGNVIDPYPVGILNGPLWVDRMVARYHYTQGNLKVTADAFFKLVPQLVKDLKYVQKNYTRHFDDSDPRLVAR